MALAGCHPGRKNVGHGFCSTCYYRWYRRNGSSEMLKKRKERDTNFMREFYKKHPEKHRLYKVKQVYGVTEEQLQSMVAAQNNVCAICGNPEIVVKVGRVQSLSIDHDHETARNRGLLCNSCNNGLGRFKHDPDLLRKAAKYMEDWEVEPLPSQ